VSPADPAGPTSKGPITKGPTPDGVKAVALGGGHGLYATLSALRLLTERVTAVVTVADDGGSSGRLRGELGVLPPGDLRMALAALADRSPSGELWGELFQHWKRTGEAVDPATGLVIASGTLPRKTATLCELRRVVLIARVSTSEPRTLAPNQEQL